MTDKVDIAALAKLARLEISPEEMSTLEKELPEILSFVDAVQKASAGTEHVVPSLRNVTRPDTDPIETGTFTEKVLAVAPARDGDRIAVKQVISRNKKS